MGGVKAFDLFLFLVSRVFRLGSKGVLAGFRGVPGRFRGVSGCTRSIPGFTEKKKKNYKTVKNSCGGQAVYFGGSDCVFNILGGWISYIRWPGRSIHVVFLFT